MSDNQGAVTQEAISKLVLKGDLSGLTQEQVVAYYNYRCKLIGLDPATKPFDIVEKGGKKFFVTNKSASEQLRRIHGISVIDKDAKVEQGLFIVTIKAQTKDGRIDIATGIKPVEGIKGQLLGDAMMATETKAKNRVTLSLCGLGMNDEDEMIDAGFSRTIDLTGLPEPEANGHSSKAIGQTFKYSIKDISEQLRENAIRYLETSGATLKEGGIWESSKRLSRLDKYEVRP